MKTLIALLCLSLLGGCAGISPEQHAQKVAIQRAHLPYVTKIGATHSMATVVRAGGVAVVSPLPYNRLQTGLIAVYWPIASSTPVAHFIGRRIGTDSWETHGMNQPGDIAALGFLLTRDNYIGVIK